MRKALGILQELMPYLKITVFYEAESHGIINRPDEAVIILRRCYPDEPEVVVLIDIKFMDLFRHFEAGYVMSVLHYVGKCLFGGLLFRIFFGMSRP